jgi:transposase
MKPHSSRIRQEAIRLYKDGKTQKSISEDLQVSCKTLRTWIKKYKVNSDEGLKPDYSSCGRKQKYRQEIIDRIIWYKREHPHWGAGFILIKLAEDFPKETLPKERQVQNYFIKYGVQPKKNKLPKSSRCERMFDFSRWKLLLLPQFYR